MLFVIICIVILGVLYYLNYTQSKTYDYKGVFVMEDRFRSDIDGYIYKDSQESFYYKKTYC